MIELMKKYNELVKRFEKADEYFAREDVSLIEKQGQAGNIQKLINDMQATIDVIRSAGYVVEEYEIRDGFRQIDFLIDKKII